MTPFMRDALVRVRYKRKKFKKALKEAGVDALMPFKQLRRARERNRENRKNNKYSKYNKNNKHNKTAGNTTTPTAFAETADGG
jgi:hypothetical protein